MFMEYKQTFQSPSARMTHPVRMTPVDWMILFGQVGQAGPGLVGGKELEIADYEPRKVIQ